MSDEQFPAEIECSLGALDLTVRGCSEEWVRETFREEWAEKLDDAAEMSQAVRDGSRGCQ